MDSKPNIQKLICEPFEKLIPKTDNMTTEQRELFLHVSGMPEDPEELSRAIYQELKKTHFATVMVLSNLLTVKFCFRTLFWITCISNKNNAVAIIYLLYVQYKAKQKNIFEVNFRWFCEKLFPEGFVTEYDLTPLFPALAHFSIPASFESIQWTELDLKLYQEAKAELNQPVSKSLGLSGSKVNNNTTKSTPNVMQMLKSNAWINNIKK